jgi:hypothetical protein
MKVVPTCQLTHNTLAFKFIQADRAIGTIARNTITAAATVAAATGTTLGTTAIWCVLDR